VEVDLNGRRRELGGARRGECDLLRIEVSLHLVDDSLVKVRAARAAEGGIVNREGGDEALHSGSAGEQSEGGVAEHRVLGRWSRRVQAQGRRCRYAERLRK
jgi:hypothetical protein